MNKLSLIILVTVCLLSNIAFASNTLTNCSTNMTLQKNTSIFYNSTWYNFTENINCDYGCDNTTNTCNPPEYQQSIILFIVIAVICFVGWKFIRWSSK